MAIAKVVTAYVDLGLTKRPSADFHAMGALLTAACPRIRVFRDFPFHNCWTVPEFWSTMYPPANARAPDRFVNAEEHVRSNLIQHCPVQWVQMAAAEDPVPDVFVWMGYSIFKQGAFTGKPIAAEHVASFLEKVEKYPFGDIPFPGITPGQTMPNPFGDNWRFCGSTVIFPRFWLNQMVASYQAGLRAFVRWHQAIPLDLAIWPAVEMAGGLPFRFYQAEYDYTQLTNFPG